MMSEDSQDQVRQDQKDCQSGQKGRETIFADGKIRSGFLLFLFGCCRCFLWLRPGCRSATQILFPVVKVVVEQAGSRLVFVIKKLISETRRFRFLLFRTRTRPDRSRLGDDEGSFALGAFHFFAKCGFTFNFEGSLTVWAPG